MHTFGRQVLRLDPHEELEIPYFSGQQLIESGYYHSIGSPRGQIQYYRRRLPDDKGIHIRDYGDRMTVHWDHVDPSANLVGHLVQDAPGVVLAGLILGAALFGGSS